jgi:A/G-specific adenine glycosylase
VKPVATRHPETDQRALRAALRGWFEAGGADHPWRRTDDPYAILVSEVMLQQTTVAAVRQNRRFERFLAAFPDPAALAAASEQDLLKAWEGLGYYNRVRNLQKTARAVLAEHGGRFPDDPAALLALPGVGRYTAHAVATFAFDRAVPVVDANVARVLSRLFDDDTPVDSGRGRELLWERAGMLVDPDAPRAFNSALMELGQTACSKNNPACLRCPVNDFCRTRRPGELPLKKSRPPVTDVTEHALFVQRPDGAILLAQEHGPRRRGMWKLPERTAAAVADLPVLSTHKYGITRYRVTLHLHECPVAALPAVEHPVREEFHPPGALSSLPMPSPIRRALETLPCFRNQRP